MRLVFQALILVGMLGVYGCTTNPEPLLFGKDACYACKMTLVDNRFGAELVTRKGKVYKFDDLNCMLGFYHSGIEEPGDFLHRLVVNHEEPGEFINADEAYYLKSKAFRTPMASEVAAFATYDRVMAFKSETGGIFLAWGEIVTQFK